MPEIETIPAPPVEGEVPQGGATQAAEPGAQVPVQSQEPAPVKVETGEPKPSSSLETRKPSEFYKDRDRYKRRVDSLEQMIKDLQNQISSNSTKTVSKAEPRKIEFDADKFFANPSEVIGQILESEKKAWREEVRKELLEKEIPGLLSKSNQESEMARRQQDAMELIFPKSGPEDKSSLTARRDSDPERAQKLDD